MYLSDREVQALVEYNRHGVGRKVGDELLDAKMKSVSYLICFRRRLRLMKHPNFYAVWRYIPEGLTASTGLVH
ncbi:MAG: hypothetical protein K9G05_05440 [Candidatus Nanopelagicales bacterium]|nr:hypothetical protein [Candidatus Nanopelagicales bacterium]MCF8539348.1 hypothetical protein [Candidatus Nanopelagicales bacterium]MCF8551507.1 hypothetical protein [Candidatus Nanopelagicales bacterium]